MTDLSHTRAPRAPTASQDAAHADEIARVRRQIERLIAARPVASIQQTSEGLVLRPTFSGFDIALFPDATGWGWTLCLDGWFEEEIPLDQAMRLIELALRGDLRVIRTTANGRPWIYRVQERAEADAAARGSADPPHRLRSGRALTSSSFAISCQMTTTDGSRTVYEWIELGKIEYVRIFACLASKKTRIFAYPISKS